MPKLDGTPTKWELREQVFKQFEKDHHRMIQKAFGKKIASDLKKGLPVMGNLLAFQRIHNEATMIACRKFVELDLPKPPTWWSSWGRLRDQIAEEERVGANLDSAKSAFLQHSDRWKDAFA